MGIFNFKALIKKFGKINPIAIIKTGGYYDYKNGGQYVQGEITKVEFTGAVTPLSKNELRFEENGTFTSEDRKLYCYEDFSTGQKIEHKGNTYTIKSKKDYSDFDDNLHIYFMKKGDDIAETN